jgi:adenine-specific DNA-methyltransferase
MPTLTWLTRDEDLKRAGAAPYRLLEEVPELGAGDRDAGNMLIQGDNLDALKALLPYYAGRVKCIYIDPPYNTRSAFEHYDDNLQHAEWLAMIYPRLELLRELLSEDGSIWVSIDDNEGHYLKVVMDEIFGRQNFIANVIWQKKYSPPNFYLRCTIIFCCLPRIHHHGSETYCRELQSKTKPIRTLTTIHVAFGRPAI